MVQLLQELEEKFGPKSSLELRSCKNIYSENHVLRFHSWEFKGIMVVRNPLMPYFLGGLELEGIPLDSDDW